MSLETYIIDDSAKGTPLEDLAKFKETNWNAQPIFHNVDDWVNGANTILYITGISGGGKGFMAKQVAKRVPGSIIIELDNFENYLWYKDDMKETGNDPVAKGNKIIKDYLTRIEALDCDIFDNSVEKYQQEMSAFIDWIRIWLVKNPHTHIIMEGIQIFQDKAFETLTKDDSFIIITSKTIFDYTRMMSRPHPIIRNRMHHDNDAQGQLRKFIDRVI